MCLRINLLLYFLLLFFKWLKKTTLGKTTLNRIVEGEILRDIADIRIAHFGVISGDNC